ncbi:hypothetical protein BDV93DRAFT_529116 [Ceratobasidium sp. AG-I]|nr:hypothetical protein BDV93DRAFT_529116 [Ceratobasidium sp. AG-I]
MTSHPCLAGAPCSCHRAGPSTPPRTTANTHSATATANRTAPALLLAALVAPAFAAPAPAPPPDLPFLYPSLARRVTDAGQAPDDPTFSPEHIEVEDLVRAGLPLKFIFDPSANLVPDSSAGAPAVDVEVPGKSGAWIVDDYWELHGKRFGPLSATATADITDDPLPTPTESASTSAVASTTAITTASPSATVLAIESSLPTGWGDKYDRSGMYPIPIVISFSIVIALMIGSLIGALVFRRGRRRSRRKKKELAAQQSGDMSDGEESLPEKVVRRGLAARVGRVIRVRNASGSIRHHSRTPDDSPRPDVELGEEERERARERSERNDLERRVKSWARRSAVWRVQARLGMRRRIAKGNKRGPADDNEDNSDSEAIDQTHADPNPSPNPDPLSRATTRPASPAASRTSTEHDRPAAVEEAAPLAPTYASPIVPNYSEGSHSQPQPGPSTSTGGGAGGGGTEGVRRDHDAHPDATPDNEPAYDYGVGLPPAYMRGEGRAEVRRGKMPMRSSTASSLEPAQEERREGGEREGERREWSALDAYAFGAGEEREGGRGVEDVTAHVATDDKRVLERLRGMTGAPREEGGVEGAVAPREEDVFGLPREVEGQASGSSPRSASTRPLPSPSSLPSTFSPPSLTTSGVLPAPSAKTGAGPVARYGEADLSLPRYLDGEPAPEVGEEFGVGLGAGLGLGGVPSAPPEEDVVGASAPPLDDETAAASAPPEKFLQPSAPPAEFLQPSAPPLEEDDIPESVHEDSPAHPLTAPRLRHLNSSAPLLDDSEHR